MSQPNCLRVQKSLFFSLLLFLACSTRTRKDGTLVQKKFASGKPYLSAASSVPWENQIGEKLFRRNHTVWTARSLATCEVQHQNHTTFFCVWKRNSSLLRKFRVSHPNPNRENVAPLLSSGQKRAANDLVFVVNSSGIFSWTYPCFSLCILRSYGVKPAYLQPSKSHLCGRSLLWIRAMCSRSCVDDLKAAAHWSHWWSRVSVDRKFLSSETFFRVRSPEACQKFPACDRWLSPHSPTTFLPTRTLFFMGNQKLTNVREHVTAEMFFCLESGRAYFTRKWPLAWNNGRIKYDSVPINTRQNSLCRAFFTFCVNVCRDNFSCNHRRMSRRIELLTCVYTDVISEVLGVNEALAADFTHVRLFSRMSPHVKPECLKTTEAMISERNAQHKKLSPQNFKPQPERKQFVFLKFSFNLTTYLVHSWSEFALVTVKSPVLFLVSANVQVRNAGPLEKLWTETHILPEKRLAKILVTFSSNKFFFLISLSNWATTENYISVSIPFLAVPVCVWLCPQFYSWKWNLLAGLVSSSLWLFYDGSFLPSRSLLDWVCLHKKDCDDKLTERTSDPTTATKNKILFFSFKEVEL